MTKTPKAALVTSLHIDPSNVVWSADADSGPRSTGMEPASFLDRNSISLGTVVRLSGERANCELILGLVSLRSSGAIADVQICSPLAIASNKRRSQPEAAFADMRGWKVPPSCGGWRSVGPSDLASYELVRAHGCDGPSSGLGAHPALFAIESARMQPVPAVQLLAEIIDPRHFVDPREPDRCSKLERFLGLDPNTASSPDQVSPYRFRYALVTACWKHGGVTKREAGASPDLFLWDTFYREGSNWVSELKAGKQAVRYLRHLWLDELYRGRVSEPLFVPEYFFGASSPRVDWFKACRSQFDSRLAV